MVADKARLALLALALHGCDDVVSLPGPGPYRDGSWGTLGEPEMLPPCDASGPDAGRQSDCEARRG